MEKPGFFSYGIWNECRKAKKSPVCAAEGKSRRWYSKNAKLVVYVVMNRRGVGGQTAEFITGIAVCLNDCRKSVGSC